MRSRWRSRRPARPDCCGTKAIWRWHVPPPLRVCRALDVRSTFRYHDANARQQVHGRFPELTSADFENAMFVVAPDRPDLVAAAIRDAHDGRLDLEAMGAAGRQYVVSNADRLLALGRYRALIRGLLAPRA